MSKRGRKDSGGFLYAFLVPLRHLSFLVVKLSDFCVSQFTKNQVELLLAVLREGGVGIDEKEVGRRRKLLFQTNHFQSSAKRMSKLLEIQTEKLLKMQEEHGYLQR